MFKLVVGTATTAAVGVAVLVFAPFSPLAIGQEPFSAQAAPLDEPAPATATSKVPKAKATPVRPKAPAKPFTVGSLTVPSAGIYGLTVERYVGHPDDAAGTEIQNGGIAAAATGDWGGVGPGEIGNLIISAHRSSDGAPMGRVPEMRNGDLIKITSNGKTYTYRAEARLWVSFRDSESRASQRLQVPGKPGVKATRPAIVLSTCATPEDHAAGDYWQDEFHNPTHRIAIVGYLVGS